MIIAALLQLSFGGGPYNSLLDRRMQEHTTNIGKKIRLFKSWHIKLVLPRSAAGYLVNSSKAKQVREIMEDLGGLRQVLAGILQKKYFHS